MTVHFICRGNALRSLIAEAYLRSLGISDLEVMSSGTVANEYKTANKVNFQRTRTLLRRHGIEQFAKDHYADQLQKSQPIIGDVVVCMNRRAYDECMQLGKLPKYTLVWDITDIGEPGRIPSSVAERWKYMEDVYQEIVQDVDRLVRQLGLAGAAV